MEFSKFGHLFSSNAGIVQLMDDLGEAMSVNRDMLMLGGGNPGQVPQVQAVLRERMQALMADGDAFERLVGDYGPPKGAPEFIAALAKLLNDHLGWSLKAENIAITNGSQSAAFILFNLFAGEMENGNAKHIQLPLTPEYIGYADQGLTHDFFTSNRPSIELIDDHFFKYHVDFDELRLSNSTGAICVSRPTNPTGNVLSNDEVLKLSGLAERHDVPLIIDSAYGTPFPNIIFTDAAPLWDEHIVLCMSLSKVGLPGVRTGIIVANEQIIRAIAGVNAILNLTTGSFGTALALDLVQSGDIIDLGRNYIQPFYKQKVERATQLLKKALNDTPFRLHVPEGAIFLWLWLPECPVPSNELYERLKKRGVLVIPGHHFFPGLRGHWPHTHECLRITYSQDPDTVERGIQIIGEEVRTAYQES